MNSQKIVSPIVDIGQLVSVWFSCGAASAVAAKKALEKYKDFAEVEILNSPVIEEDEDNRRFLEDVQNWLNHPIKIITNPKFPKASAVDIWDKGWMGGIQGAPCTLELKKVPRQLYEKRYNPDWHVLGFTADEVKRHIRFTKFERENLLPVLIEDGITKQRCFDIIRSAGLQLPRIYSLGYPNANCIGCVKATSPTYWNHVRKMHPEVFHQRAEQSRRIGCRLTRVKNERIFLDELKETDRGYPMRKLDIDCGIFCEEKGE